MTLDRNFYQVLARKWRPRNFMEVVGQDAVVLALKHALEHQHLHHAYLFTGTRGVGKTTLARLLAKAMSCEQQISFTPCGKCPNCLAIDQGSFPDLVEIDAASNTRVEDIRELLNQTVYTPIMGRFKIYLIDEVHMLSMHSFNALLKTLEEPPKHVKFLLATTDPQKLPVTILSRVLRFNLKSLSQNTIVKQLATILTSEKITFKLEALNLIAKAAKGSMRDALTILEQVLAYSDYKSLAADDLSKLLGLVDPKAALELLTFLLKLDATALFDKLNFINKVSVDWVDLLDELLLNLQQLSLMQSLPAYYATLDDNNANAWRIDELKNLVNLTSAENLQLYYQILLLGKRDLAFSATPLSGIEMIFLRCLAFSADKVLAKAASTQELITSSLAPKGEVAAAKIVNNVSFGVNADRENLKTTKKALPIEATVEAPIKVLEREAVSSELSAAALAPSNDTNNAIDFNNLLKTLPCKGLLKNVLEHCTYKSYQDDILTLELDSSQQALLSSNVMQRLQKLIIEALKKPTKVDILVSHLKVQPTTIAAASDKARQQELNKALEDLKADTTVRALQEQLQAKLELDQVHLVSTKAEGTSQASDG